MKQKRIGRPPRTDDPVPLTVTVASELRKWLKLRAVQEERDMGDIVTETLTAYRKRVEKRRGGKR